MTLFELIGQMEDKVKQSRWYNWYQTLPCTVFTSELDNLINFAYMQGQRDQAILDHKIAQKTLLEGKTAEEAIKEIENA